MLGSFYLFCFVFFIAYACVLFMYTAVNLSVLSLNVRGIREQMFIFYKKPTLNRPMKIRGRMNGVAKSSFPTALNIVKVYVL